MRITIDANAPWKDIMRTIRSARSSTVQKRDQQKAKDKRRRRTAVRQRKQQKGKGLLLGANSPFNGIPIIGDIL